MNIELDGKSTLANACSGFVASDRAKEMAVLCGTESIKLAVSKCDFEIGKNYALFVIINEI